MYAKIEPNLSIAVMQTFVILQYSMCCLLRRNSAEIVFKCFNFCINMYRYLYKFYFSWSKNMI